jgi:hypothetical protein
LRAATERGQAEGRHKGAYGNRFELQHALSCTLHGGCPARPCVTARNSFGIRVFITFDKGYLDYSEYERFTKEGVFYVTRLKDNARYSSGKEFDIPDKADSGVLKDEEILLYYGKDGKEKHRSRRIAYLGCGK